MSDESTGEGRSEIAGAGRRSDLDSMVPRVYEDMRAMAVKLLVDQGPAVTLQPTSLVHEAYLRLLDQRRTGWEDRLHFFCIAARVMRRVLADHCRRRLAQKRGGAVAKIDLADAAVGRAPRELDVLTVDRLLTDLEALDAEQARIVELRFFSGLTLDETAAALGISKATVKRHWALAKAWMARELGRPPAGHGS